MIIIVFSHYTLELFLSTHSKVKLIEYVTTIVAEAAARKEQHEQEIANNNANSGSGVNSHNNSSSNVLNTAAANAAKNSPPKTNNTKNGSDPSTTTTAGTTAFNNSTTTPAKTTNTTTNNHTPFSNHKNSNNTTPTNNNNTQSPSNMHAAPWSTSPVKGDEHSFNFNHPTLTHVDDSSTSTSLLQSPHLHNANILNVSRHAFTTADGLTIKLTLTAAEISLLNNTLSPTKQYANNTHLTYVTTPAIGVNTTSNNAVNATNTHTHNTHVSANSTYAHINNKAIQKQQAAAQLKRETAQILISFHSFQKVCDVYLCGRVWQLSNIVRWVWCVCVVVLCRWWNLFDYLRIVDLEQ